MECFIIQFDDSVERPQTKMKRSNDTSLIEGEKKKKKIDSPIALQSDIKVAISASIDCSGDRSDSNARPLQLNYGYRSSKADQQQDGQTNAAKAGTVTTLLLKFLARF